MALLAVVIALVLALVPRNQVRVLGVTWPEPGAVHVMVASCNAAPEVDVNEAAPGRYEVSVRATQAWDRGEDCGDVVTIAVDEALAALTIVDIVGDREFELPAEPPPPAIDIDGSWRLLAINGRAVDVGERVPVLWIEAGLARGRADCGNQAVAELLEDGARLRRADSITTTGIGCDEPSPDDLLWRRIWGALATDQGVGVTRVGDRMIWISVSDRLEFERVG